MTKHINTLDAPCLAHNSREITELINTLLDQNSTVRYTEVPRPRAMPAMPTHPSKEVKVNPFTANLRAYI